MFKFKKIALSTGIVISAPIIAIAAISCSQESQDSFFKNLESNAPIALTNQNRNLYTTFIENFPKGNIFSNSDKYTYIQDNFTTDIANVYFANVSARVNSDIESARLALETRNLDGSVGQNSVTISKNIQNISNVSFEPTTMQLTFTYSVYYELQVVSNAGQNTSVVESGFSYEVNTNISASTNIQVNKLRTYFNNGTNNLNKISENVSFNFEALFVNDLAPFAKAS
ncbi:hypothetical protein EI74_0436 [Mycoplasma testudineum]|uniref:Lipoprotein-associated protein n=1 Tax=Mycoplasma testudineum TaxID=244584 RepID=A0A4R6IF97_9MOLU|nr:hypothetical protein [Mycoplasma testudineum]OYD26824.1 hypothetical protein CG473_01800 [Mycoplasma testudineum]TDO20358.1 hypothetical protein EI74_0436 [Mycoplasma testudineum]